MRKDLKCPHLRRIFWATLFQQSIHAILSLYPLHQQTKKEPDPALVLYVTFLWTKQLP
ncbi:hypothetical protein E1A91_A05G172800v1 [Gossypium mustelinum]|uniref:Uncharacterized protein n=1 Tax=Gossypium mustelinum TaxID=34275 RepID=A0A5D2Z6C3_GOSMU|nr:hypothetical protein E1A91_A05G172800v1 [Gossypium mustelinum]